MNTLPDYLEPGLNIVLVGINPSVYSVERRDITTLGPATASGQPPTGRACSASRWGQRNDSRVLEFGVGLTDVVKQPSSSANKLRAADYRRWAPVLKEKIRRFKPRIVCFQGIAGYRNYLRYGEGGRFAATPQAGTAGAAAGIGNGVSGAEFERLERAVHSLDNLVGWYLQLKALQGRTDGRSE